MIDHIGFPVSDYARAKAFYEQALAPLGYTLIMEASAQQTESGSPAAGFGKNGKPDFWIGGEGALNGVLHVAITAESRAAVDAFYQAALSAGGKDNGAPVCGRSTIRTTTAPSCSTPTATISRRSATPRRDCCAAAARHGEVSAGSKAAQDCPCRSPPRLIVPPIATR